MPSTRAEGSRWLKGEGASLSGGLTLLESALRHAFSQIAPDLR